MKQTCIRTICCFFLALLLCGTAVAADTPAWGSVQEGTAILVLPETEGDKFTCQIGNISAEIESVTSLSDLDTPVETIILIDNSFSIQKDQRPVIKELLNDLIANRLAGERYTIATISDQVNYLCSDELEYAALKSLVDNIEFKDQRTQLTDGLYHVLEALQQSDEGTLRRLLIIADGVDNKQVGYTQSELSTLIKEVGYPIYTVGCTNKSASATDELQNLFALSRLTSGNSYYLPEVQNTMDIVSGVISWNGSVRVKIRLPEEICDGMPKMVRVVSGDGAKTYLLELNMPLAELQEPVETPEPLPERVADPEPEPEPEPEKSFSWGIPVISILTVAAGIAVVVLLRKKQQGNRIEESPNVKPPLETPAATEVLSGSKELSGETEGIWNSQPSTRVILQNLDQPSHKIEVVLKGELLVGRDGSVCQVVLTEPSVARKQCRIFQQGSWTMISNLSQSNVTKLDGHPVIEDCELLSGSTLQMGRLRMRVEII